MFRSFSALAGVAAVCLASAPPLGAQEALRLEPLIEEALRENPDLATLRHRRAAAEAVRPAAGALDDPQLRLELSNMPWRSLSFDETPMSGKQLVLSQKLPYPGKRDARRRRAQSRAEAEDALYRDRRAAVVQQVKEAFFTLSFLDRALHITRKNGALLDDLARIAKSRYAVGNGLQQDVLKAHVAQSDLQNRLIEFEGRRRRAAARLNTLLNRPPQGPLGPAPPVEATPLEASLDSLQAALEGQRPRLQGLQARIGAENAAAALARLESRPDFSVNLGYRQRATMGFDPVRGEDFLSVGLAFNLPLYQGGKQAPRLEQALNRRQAAQAAYEAEAQRLRLELQVHYIDAATHRRQADLVRSRLIPQADQALQAALAGYQVGKVDFLTLLDSQITLLAQEIQYHHHLTAYEKALAGIEAAVGTRLF